MARRVVSVEGTDVMVADDDPLAADLQQWAIVRARAVDELTGQPPRRPVRLVSPLRHATVRVADGGLCGLVARPRDVAGALQTPGGIVARIDMPGYLPRDLTPDIDAARRQLVFFTAQGATSMIVVPPDPIPAPPAQRLQFRPGRGVLTGRTLPVDPDDFTRVDSTAPLGANHLPRVDPLSALRFGGEPVAGVPLALGDVPLHRSQAAAIRGRVQRTIAGPPPGLQPATTASIGALGYWSTYPSTKNTAAAPIDFVALDPPLYIAQVPGATLEGITPAPVGAPRTLQALAPLGAADLLVHPHAGLNPAGGDRLRIGNPLEADLEIVVTAGFTPPLDAALPARVRLRAPTARLHRVGTVIADCALNLPVGAGSVLREAQPGDAVVFGGALQNLPTAGWLVVARNTAGESIHRYRQIPRATPTGNPPPADYVFAHTPVIDAAGGFDWPAIARVAQLAVISIDGAQRVPQFNFALDYEGDNAMSLVLS